MPWGKKNNVRVDNPPRYYKQECVLTLGQINWNNSVKPESMTAEMFEQSMECFVRPFPRILTGLYDTHKKRVCKPAYPSPLSRTINKSDVNSHTTPIFKNLKLLKFHDINKLQVYQFMFRFKTHSPPSFKGLCTSNIEVHSHYPRSRHLFHIPSKRIKVSQFVLSYRGPFLFNSLSKKIENCNSYSSFTYKLKDYLFSLYT